MHTDTHSRHGYSTSPRRHSGQHPSSRRAPPDPHHFDYPASLKQYADWFRYHYQSQAAEEDSADKQAEQEAGDGSKPRNGIKTRWEKYKKDFAATQVSHSSHFREFLCVCTLCGSGPVTVHVFCSHLIIVYSSTKHHLAYCSFKPCLNTTGNHHGLPKNMTQHQTSKTCANA